MTFKGNSAIWRATTPTGNNDFPEPNAGDKIEFDIDAVTPDATGHIGNTSASIKTGIAENEAPFRDVNELQFTRVEGVTVVVRGHIQSPNTSAVSIKLKVWALDDQAIQGTFEKGRFGARFNDNPGFNVKPYSKASTHARGYAIEQIDWVRSELKGRLDFVMTLRLSGDLKNGTGTNYDWST